MHSLETGIIVSIAALFFLSFLTFTFLREINISKNIDEKVKSEISEYKESGTKKYVPEVINNVLDIIVKGGSEYVGENEE